MNYTEEGYQYGYKIAPHAILGHIKKYGEKGAGIVQVQDSDDLLLLIIDGHKYKIDLKHYKRQDVYQGIMQHLSENQK